MNLISKARLETICDNFNKINPIIVVGDIGIDKYTEGSVSRISPEAPVPVLRVTKEWEKLGLAANISDNLKTLGVDSTLCGVIGNDVNGDRFESLLEDCQLKTWGLVHEKGRMTTFKERATTATQQICRIDYESSNYINEKTAERLYLKITDFFSNHGAVIVEDYGKGTLREDFLSEIISKAKKDNKLLAVDPARTTPPLFYKGASLLKPNHTEALLMVKGLGHYSDNLSIEEVGKILINELEVEKLVITLGKDGMALVDSKVSEETTFIPTVANEVFDVSGAGDTAIALLVSCLSSGATLEEAAWISNCGAGVVVAKIGTATVNLEDLLKFHHSLEIGLNV